MGRLMYRLYGMYLSARMGAEAAARRNAGAGPSVFAIARRRPPDARRGYPWGQVDAGPHPLAPPTAPLALRGGPPPGWPLEASFAMALLQWASQLRWLPGQGHVMYVELALDFEAHAERALPAPSDHRLRGVTLPLCTRRRVLKMAPDAPHPHLQARDLVQGKEVWMAKSLLPLWGFRCVGRAARPLFARPNALYGRGAWRGRERGGRMCFYWITSPRQDQGCSPCGPFSACRAGAGSVAASQAARGSPTARKCPRPRSPSPVCVTR